MNSTVRDIYTAKVGRDIVHGYQFDAFQLQEKGDNSRIHKDDPRAFSLAALTCV